MRTLKELLNTGHASGPDGGCPMCEMARRLRKLDELHYEARPMGISVEAYCADCLGEWPCINRCLAHFIIPLRSRTLRVVVVPR